MAKKGQRGDGGSAIVQGQPAFTIQRRNRYWEVRDPVGDLVCLAVYKCGAKEVVRRMACLQEVGIEPTTARL